jgi:hypothetical protein
LSTKPGKSCQRFIWPIPDMPGMKFEIRSPKLETNSVDVLIDYFFKSTGKETAGCEKD